MLTKTWIKCRWQSYGTNENLVKESVGTYTFVQLLTFWFKYFLNNFSRSDINFSRIHNEWKKMTCGLVSVCFISTDYNKCQIDIHISARQRYTVLQCYRLNVKFGWRKVWFTLYWAFKYDPFLFTQRNYYFEKKKKQNFPFWTTIYFI